MIPVIKPGQRVSVSPRSLEMIRKNDIIAYKLDVNPWITVHRVISIRKNGKKFCFKTKGDHMEVVDPYEVSETSYLGIVNTSVIQEDSTQWLESCPF
jgi:signal peptidase I